MRKAATSGMFAALVLLAVTPSWAADAAQGLEVRQFQRYTLNSPFSGPIEAIAMTNHPVAGRGTLMDLFVAVQNHSNDTTASVVIDLDLRYADGARVVPFDLGAARAWTFLPDEGIGFYIFWQIPAQAPLGTARLTGNARVARLSGGDETHADNENPMVATDSVSFEVTP